MADKPKPKYREIPGEREKERRARVGYDFRDTRKGLREKAMAQIPPGKLLKHGDTEGVKQAILDGLAAHPNMFTNLKDMCLYLQTKHGVNYVPERIGQLFRKLGVAQVDGTYMVLPFTLTQGDAWEQFTDDLRVFLAGDPRLLERCVYLSLRGGTPPLVELDLEGVRLDPANRERILAVTTGWSDVVIHFDQQPAAKRFWAKCMRAHKPNWDDPNVTDPNNVKDALLALLKQQGVISEGEACKILEVIPADFRLLMTMLMDEYPISQQGSAYSIHTGSLFYKEQGIGGKRGVGWKSEAQLRELEREGDEEVGEEADEELSDSEMEDDDERDEEEQPE